jgi:aryl-alcohol dehydrogenase-like predicted oxidoreductase
MSVLPVVHLPGTDLDVSALCFGAGPLGIDVRGADADRLLGAFVDAGGSFFDTAHCYEFWKPDGPGQSERELGAALRRLGVRDRCVVATKGGHPAVEPGYPRPADFLAPEVLARDITDSLGRLGDERIDLYYLHRDDGRTPVAEIIGALNEEVRRGRVRHIGASNWSVARLREANDYAKANGLQGFVASQVQWSLAEPTWRSEPTDPTVRRVGPDEEAFHRETGVPLVTYSATAGGWFGGSGARLYDTPENHARKARAERLAAELGVTPAQIAVAWLRSQPGLTVIPLFGTRSPDHLAEIVAAASVALTPEQVRWLYGGDGGPAGE